jgi:hypothetical protein
VVALAAVLVTAPHAAEKKIDLDGNPVNGEESRVVTRVVSTYPVQIENTIFNNALGESFVFQWPGAGPGGFDSFVTAGPDVGTLWLWTSALQVYSIETDITFQPARSVPVFGSPTGGVQPVDGGQSGEYLVPGKSLNPTEVTLSTTSLLASLVTFFSPRETLASCGTQCADSVCQVEVFNEAGGPAFFQLALDGCCLEENQIFCDDVCTSYLTDVNNCGACGNVCGPGEFCSEGVCACPEGLTQCGDGCVDLLSDPDNCGACGTQCSIDQFCPGGDCACLDEGLSICDGVCVDLLNDDNNCGTCGNVCAFDAYCSAGICEERCPGQDLCGEECVSLDSDPLNCGACGNVCGENAICGASECSPCTGQTKTACNNECVSLHKDPDNCGACGFVCDFSGCPSEGQGACSQGSSCVCSDGSAASIRFDPDRIDSPGRTKVKPLQSFSSEPPPWRASTRARPAKSEPSRQTAAATESVAGTVEEAPVCAFDPFAEIIQDGQHATIPLGSGRWGRETQATIFVETSEGIRAKGPCPIVLPVVGASTEGVILSPVAVDTLDDGGNFLCDPEDAWCEFRIKAVNVGDSACVNPTATLSSPPNPFDPNELVFNNAQSSYASWPAYPGLGEPLQENTNTVAFSINPAGQTPEHGRPFVLTVDCTNRPDPVEMNVVLGFGAACDPSLTLDGQTYDGIQGLLPPLDAPLVPEGDPVNVSDSSINSGSTVPLKLAITCGGQVLGDAQIDPNPQIVALCHGIRHQPVARRAGSRLTRPGLSPGAPFAL